MKGEKEKKDIGLPHEISFDYYFLSIKFSQSYRRYGNTRKKKKEGRKKGVTGKPVEMVRGSIFYISISARHYAPTRKPKKKRAKDKRKGREKRKKGREQSNADF